MQNDVLNVFLFKEKHLCWNLFCNKVEGPHPCNFIKKETPILQKNFKIPILKNMCERLLLNLVYLLQFQMNQSYVLLKTKQMLSRGSKHELS